MTKKAHRTSQQTQYRPVPWKRNIIKIPDKIMKDVNHFTTPTFVVSGSKKIPLEAIEQGMYSHLGIRIEENAPRHPNEVIPLPELGRYSTKNRTGYTIVHRDLPMILRSWTIESPNYGDWNKGSHETVFSVDTYQKTRKAPKLLSIKIEVIGKDARDESLIFKFTADEVLNRNDPDVLDDLLFNLNLLQENIGLAGVFATDASRAEYLSTLYVNWEIFPPGERDATFERILSGVRNADPRLKAEIRDRYEFLLSLRPHTFVRGTNGFQNYFGAIFPGNVVVFENMQYGNAVYIMFEQWEELSKKSRSELLSGPDGDFRRVVHGKNWKRKLFRIVRREIARRTK